MTAVSEGFVSISPEVARYIQSGPVGFEVSYQHDRETHSVCHSLTRHGVRVELWYSVDVHGELMEDPAVWVERVDLGEAGGSLTVAQAKFLGDTLAEVARVASGWPLVGDTD